MKKLKFSILCCVFVTLSVFSKISWAQNFNSVEIPSSVLALTASHSYKAELRNAEQWLLTFPNPNKLQKNIVILGYQTIMNDNDAGQVIVSLGAPTFIWPTCIFRIGEIRANVRFFPDGINKRLAEEVKFYGDTVPTPVRNCM